jgi:hypothetical protein
MSFNINTTIKRAALKQQSTDYLSDDQPLPSTAREQARARKARQRQMPDAQKTPRIIAGARVYPGTPQYEIRAALDVLRQNGLGSRRPGGQSEKMNNLAVMLAFGGSISSEPIGFSLLTNQTDLEEIDNENIMPDYSHVQNKKIPTTTNFKNIDDSFYTLDDTAPLKIQQSLEECAPSTFNEAPDSLTQDVAAYFASNRKLIKRSKR